MAEQYSQTGAGSGSQPPGESFERPAAGTYAGLAVAALLVASAVFILLVDRSLRRPSDIPEVLQPTAAAADTAVPTRQAPAVIPVTPEPIVIDLEVPEGPFELLPTPTAVPVHTEAPARYFLVTVQSGDTLAAIASRYGYSFEEIAELNGIDEPYVIHIGDELLFPNR
ncbi:MAG: LysM peptidoglycan-binding domain-containing protein [Chloroflexi bacterium]|nr:LysM peptidoglycan-binding domain-containing protein [Chloroflexota bacterium]